jgi:CheY-like chemotaxis protein
MRMAGEPILIVDDNPANLKLARMLPAVIARYLEPSTGGP